MKELLEKQYPISDVRVSEYYYLAEYIHTENHQLLLSE